MGWTRVESTIGPNWSQLRDPGSHSANILSLMRRLVGSGFWRGGGVVRGQIGQKIGSRECPLGLRIERSVCGRPARNCQTTTQRLSIG